MKITIKWLEDKSACSEAIKEFSGYKDGNDTDSITVLKTLIKKDKLDWGNWLCTRLFTHKQNIAYAIYAAEQVISPKVVLKHNTKLNRDAVYAAADAVAEVAEMVGYDVVAHAAYAAYAAYVAYAADAAAMKLKIIKYGIKLLQKANNDTH